MNMGQQSFARKSVGPPVSSRCRGFGKRREPIAPKSSRAKKGWSAKPLSSKRYTTLSPEAADGTTNHATARPAKASTRESATAALLRSSTPVMARHASSMPMRKGCQFAYGENFTKLCMFTCGSISRSPKRTGHTWSRKGSSRVQSQAASRASSRPLAPLRAARRSKARTQMGVTIQKARSAERYQEAPFSALWKGVTQACMRLAVSARSSGFAGPEATARRRPNACSGQTCAYCHTALVVPCLTPESMSRKPAMRKKNWKQYLPPSHQLQSRPAACSSPPSGAGCAQAGGSVS
mmetsp:Transcript_55982/g.179670  ORF Transcript_55982/g.179670 Transcript_55982/m.179670 type:complete len:294 (-) Transcript_55982:1220-2101(-)